MEKSKRTPQQQKIADALSRVRINLVAFKKRADSPLVISRDGKTTWIKPWLENEDVSEIYRNKQKK